MHERIADRLDSCTGVYVAVKPGPVTPSQKMISGGGNHGGIIAAEFQRRNMA